jgi:hypothetical protein
MNNVAPRLRLLLACGVVALGGCGPSSVQPIDVMVGCPQMPVRGPEEFAFAPPETVIDDFEDGDLKLTPVAGRTGSWVGFGTSGATIFGESSNRCAARGMRAGHLTSAAPPGSTYVAYSANWNAVMIDPFSEAHPWDASAYSGFSFWMATGTSSPFQTPMGVSTVDTLPAGGVCSNPNGCNDYYAIRMPSRTITLTNTWTRYVFKFADLKQFGFGIPLVPLNKSKLVSLLIWPEDEFDIWIDDVRFEP